MSMKYKLNAFVISSLFASINILYAASGACSGHGGVSCGAGPDSDGSVICVDGWENSSVSYSSMVKCAGYNVSEPAPAVVPTIVPVTAQPTVKKEIPVVATPSKPTPIPGAKPLVTGPVATSSPKKINQAQKGTTSPLAHPIATSTVENATVVTPTSPQVKEGKVFSIFKRFKFW